jgi:hypothetical protein
MFKVWCFKTLFFNVGTMTSVQTTFSSKRLLILYSYISETSDLAENAIFKHFIFFATFEWAPISWSVAKH